MFLTALLAATAAATTAESPDASAELIEQALPQAEVAAKAATELNLWSSLWHSDPLVIFVLLILIGFLCGGILVTWLYPYLNLHTFLIPVFVSLAMSLTYWALYLRKHLHH